MPKPVNHLTGEPEFNGTSISTARTPALIRNPFSPREVAYYIPATTDERITT